MAMAFSPLKYVVMVLLSIVAGMVQSNYAADEFTAYLFAYFTGNSGNQEAIRFALSDDGHTYKALNRNSPVLSSATISSTGGVRDPHILRGENSDYYMVATDMVSAQGWASNHGIVMLRSSNLIDWKSKTIDIRTAFSKYQVADRVWAPQTIYDPSVKKYMVYFAMRLGATDVDKIYWAYADSSFTKLETEPKVLYSYSGKSAIDADIVYKDSLYYLFFKTEGNGNGIKSATCSTLTGQYILYDKYLQVTSNAVEGSCVFKLINSNNWVLMYDMYTSGKYEFALSTNLKTFTADPKPISFDFTPRHGTVIPVTDKERWALYAKWDPTSVQLQQEKVPAAAQPIVRGGILYLSSSRLTVEVTVSVFDGAGKMVFRGERVNRGAMRLPHLAKGVYEARVETGMRDAATTGRFVVW